MVPVRPRAGAAAPKVPPGRVGDFTVTGPGIAGRGISVPGFSFGLLRVPGIVGAVTRP
ncbi:hypothetical protein [Tabrizicola soli]|uniref:Uncharacterized protein n=1 Tax=Tabrizicola soli TaxID=2185115 RepID=A0ABV7DSR2_9RHOB